MTKVLCDWFIHLGGKGGFKPGFYQCDYLGDDGCCTLEEIKIHNSCGDGVCAGCQNASFEKRVSYPYPSERY